MMGGYDDGWGMGWGMSGLGGACVLVAVLVALSIVVFAFRRRNL